MQLIENLFSDKITQLPTKGGLGDELVNLGSTNEKIVVLTADLSESTGVAQFSKIYPKRFIQVGVAEQNMAGISAGLALSGKVVFMTSYSMFSPGLNWLQIRTSICYSNANVKIASTHSGYSAGPDGATHQALEDVALTRVLPNLVVLSPCDYTQAKKVTSAAASFKGPVYIRYSRIKTPVFTKDVDDFQIGSASVLVEGDNVTIASHGPVLYQVLKAAHVLKKKHKVSCEVIDFSTIKPLDEKTLLKSAAKTKKVVIVEEHQIIGGLGSAVCEILSENLPVPVMRIGSQDKFGESGSYDELLAKFGLDYAGLEEKIGLWTAK